MPRPRRVDTRTARLCSQVARILELSLPDHCPEWVPWLTVLEVLPDPNAARLRVVLGFDPATADRLPETRAVLDQLRAELREEVAQGIHRKRVPDLVWQLLPLS